MTVSHNGNSSDREKDGIISKEFTTQSVPPLAQITKEILDQLADSISATQTALLAGRLPELERGLSQQVELCERLRSLLNRGNASHAPHAALHTHAKAALDRLRVFTAILRRMQRAFTAMRIARQGASLTYGPPRGNASYGCR